QAEDGIRDDLVTGVQTCALPIYLAASRRAPSSLVTVSIMSVSSADVRQFEMAGRKATSPAPECEGGPPRWGRGGRRSGPRRRDRSEERRVGTARRSAWSEWSARA